ncbi:hypothetical protein [Tardiphaga sp.]|uniref:hypothetical protein n=1 Tax=Tardiphaga sp. TaxID=1926292 RepID=UPI002606957F|nr:hypothetical protein [Tardiphaga sp.]
MLAQASRVRLQVSRPGQDRAIADSWRAYTGASCFRQSCPVGRSNIGKLAAETGLCRNMRCFKGTGRGVFAVVPAIARLATGMADMNAKINTSNRFGVRISEMRSVSS